ncbi:hypothetical protein L228DRAFT_127217 [Xylona heveae TC161]|uniref:Uncharacterized protein n=1 Tax=Xylona heveae (strain CBS 132557 / TC161) TaxID=1328760 RepID=A0A165GR75_XYLHT|nr:hypothetical protein L228DRAFT_127217 [Xylona heveae TC161]KZF22492.1 hypothetical protein L228DRAFT_127217 [Xylona heveae TC161]
MMGNPWGNDSLLRLKRRAIGTPASSRERPELLSKVRVCVRPRRGSVLVHQTGKSWFELKVGGTRNLTRQNSDGAGGGRRRCDEMRWSDGDRSKKAISGQMKTKKEKDLKKRGKESERADSWLDQVDGGGPSGGGGGGGGGGGNVV